MVDSLQIMKNMITGLYTNLTGLYSVYPDTLVHIIYIFIIVYVMMLEPH